MTTASQSVGHHFKNIKSQLKFLKHACISYHFKAILVVNVTAKAPQTIMLGHHIATEKHSHFFSSQREESLKAQTEIK